MKPIPQTYSKMAAGNRDVAFMLSTMNEKKHAEQEAEELERLRLEPYPTEAYYIDPSEQEDEP